MSSFVNPWNSKSLLSDDHAQKLTHYFSGGVIIVVILIIMQTNTKKQIQIKHVKMKIIKIGVLAILSGLRRARLKKNAKNAEK